MMTEPFISAEVIALVVLLPCAPATAKTRLSFSTKGRASLRERQTIPFLRAACSSTLSSLIAAE